MSELEKTEASLELTASYVDWVGIPKNWLISLFSDRLELRNHKDELLLTIDASRLQSQIKFPLTGIMTENSVVLKSPKKKYGLRLGDADLATLQSWIEAPTSEGHPSTDVEKIEESESTEALETGIHASTDMEKLEESDATEVAKERDIHALTEMKKARESPESTMRRDIRGWGTGLILMSFVQLLLNSIWGVVLFFVGILNLAFVNPGMFVVNGVVITIAGVSTLAVGLTSQSPGWVIFSILQFAWGANEIKKYFFYKRRMPNSEFDSGEVNSFKVQLSRELGDLGIKKVVEELKALGAQVTTLDRVTCRVEVKDRLLVEVSSLLWRHKEAGDLSFESE